MKTENIQTSARNIDSYPSEPLAPPPPPQPTITNNLTAAASNSPRRTSTHSRRGTVARLPKTVRDRVNHMLDDGFTHVQIAQNLLTDAPGLNPEHVRRWKSSGYQDYLREQRLIQQCVARSNHIVALLRQPGQIHGFQAAQQIATAQICQILTEIGPDILREALQSNPLNYFRMLNSFSRLATGDLNCQLMLDEQSEARAKSPPSDPPSAGLAPQTLDTIKTLLSLCGPPSRPPAATGS